MFAHLRPPPLTRRGSAELRRRELTYLTGSPDPYSELSRRKVVAVTERRHGVPRPPGIQPVAGRWLVDPGHRKALQEKLIREVDAHSSLHPLEPGLTIGAACRRLDLPDRRIVESLAEAPLAVREGRVLRAEAWHALPAEVASAVEGVRRDLTEAPFAAADHARLSSLGLSSAGLAAAVRAGVLVRVADDVYLAPDALDQAERRLAALPQPFTNAGTTPF